MKKDNMRKTIRNGIGRRAVYKFRCTGPCRKTKNTYVYERAKAGVCLTCDKKYPMVGQDSLFETVIVGEIQVINPEATERLKKATDESIKLRAEAIDEFFYEGNFTQEHLNELDEANRRENNRLDALRHDMRIV